MIWTLICLQPHLALAIPFVIVFFCLLVPAFLHLHPAPKNDIPLPPDLDAWSTSTGKTKDFGGTASGRDFLLNMRDIQNSMDDFTKAYDKIATTVNSYVSFVDEKKSSVVLWFCVLAGTLTVAAASFIPMRFLVLLAGWILLLSGHTSFKLLIHNIRNFSRRSTKVVTDHINKQIDDEYIDPQALPETRPVLVYEYRNAQGEPFYSGFSTIGNAGNEDEYITNNIEIVLPPPGYAFVDKNKWTVVERTLASQNGLTRTTLRRNVIRCLDASD